jgi:hypothetical protein
MDAFLEFIIQFIADLIPRYFGAFLKWIFYRGKMSYSNVLKENGNTRLGYIAIAILILVTLLFVKVYLP